MPYHDYLLYKPSGSERTKAYFAQQKSDSSFGSCGEFSKTTLDEESGVTAVDCDVSLTLASADVSTVLENSAEYCEELESGHIPPPGPSDQSISDFSPDLPDRLSSTSHLAADGANTVAEMSSSRADDDQLSAENRKRVSEFFSHSRLHHISTWGAEYKAYVTQLQAQVGGSS